MLWNRAPRDQVQVTINPSGPVLSGLGLDSILGFGSQDVQPAFSNILVPRLSVEFVASDQVTLIMNEDAVARSPGGRC